MSNAGQDIALSFDDILEAVKETARGRWFVESLESRTRVGNTTRILDAIARLEDRVEEISQSTGDAVLVKKARESIIAARQDIARIENKASLSTEARLFAQLAGRARDEFNSNGMARALTLVEDLERELNPHGADMLQAVPLSEPAPEPAKAAFFEADEAIFEAAPTIAPSPVSAPAPEQPKEPGAAKGAKVVIHKLSTALAEIPTPGDAPAALTVAEKDIETEPAASRIHVTRSNPGEAEVPLLEEPAPAA